MTTDVHTIIVTDANVLINLMHVVRLDLCSRLPGYEFVVPDHVREEITDANQRMALDDAVVGSVVRIESITDLSAVTLFAELIAHIARGEAACLTGYLLCITTSLRIDKGTPSRGRNGRW